MSKKYNSNSDKSQFLDQVGVPFKSYVDLRVGPKQHLDPKPPPCPKCALPAEPRWGQNDWYCHFCCKQVHAPVGPNAMIPRDTTSTFAPLVSDWRAEYVCWKCVRSLLPLADNSGFKCPTCDYVYQKPPPKRELYFDKE